MEHSKKHNLLIKNEEKESLLRNFGKNLKLKRKDQGLTQEKLGEIACLNHKYIGELERGEKNPTMIVIYKIAMALGIKITELFSVEKDELSKGK